MLFRSVRAFKPGNVSIAYPLHDMNEGDFIRSALAILDPITTPHASVGERIEKAIQATRQVVDCNTNLGIVLLLAPIVKAVEHLEPPISQTALQNSLNDTLSHLTKEDAEACYRAIRMAAPSGLGEVGAEDIAQAPTESLRSVMQRAASWDEIARAYAEGYQSLWDIGVTGLIQALDRGRPLLWATTEIYLSFLEALPDSHLVRRHGAEAGAIVQHMAKKMIQSWKACGDAAIAWKTLQSFDFDLKSQKFNPGTSADLSIASLLLLHLMEPRGYNARRQLSLGQRFSARPNIG